MQYLLSFHLIALIAWFAGLFYLPRLFVYHATATDTIGIERFIVMERRLYKAIMNPAMIATAISGFWLFFLKPHYYLNALWMHAKMLLILILIIYHHFCGYYLKKFAAYQNSKSHVYFRFFNEVPSIILIAVVILAVVKPF